MQFSLWRLLVVVTAIAIVIGIVRALGPHVVGVILSLAVCFGVSYWIEGLAIESESNARYTVLALAAAVLAAIIVVGTLMMIVDVMNG